MKIIVSSALLALSLLLMLNLFVKAESPYSPLLITEVMPNPLGDDSKYEWIEIKNISEDSQNLKEWNLNSKILSDIVIEANEIVIVARNLSGFNELYQVQTKVIQADFNLVNNGGTVKLENSLIGASYEFKYLQAVEDRSFELLQGDCGTVRLSETHSAGGENTLCPTNEPTSALPSPSTYSKTGSILISTLNPNPSSGDEWVELTNNDNKVIDLSGWKLKDASNKVFSITYLILKQGQIERIYPKTISLNNDGDTIYLYNGSDVLVDQFQYTKSTKGELLNRSTSENSKELNISNLLSEEVIANGADSQNKEDSTGNESLSIKNEAKINYNIYFKKPIFYKLNN